MGNKPQSRALTGLFLGHDDPLPSERPLPHAPVGNPSVVLPVGGLNVLFGRAAPRVVRRRQRCGELAAPYHTPDTRLTSEPRPLRVSIWISSPDDVKPNM